MTETKKKQYKTQRRSERLFLTIPIRVSGTDPKGRDFVEQALSVNVSRHGARIRLRNSLTVDDVVHIKNLRNNKEAPFRVVGRVGEPRSGQSYADWGVDILDRTIEIWGVDLKENPLEETAFSALLQCNNCSLIASYLLTYKEFGAAGASSFITRHCPRCDRETLWSYVASNRRQAVLSAGAKPVLVKEEEEKERRGAEERRREQRLAIQVPIRIRTPEGEEEICTTLDLSRRGTRFLGAGKYEMGSILFVTAPYRKGEKPLEMRASVEQIEDLPGSPKKIYGLKFEFKES